MCISGNLLPKHGRFENGQLKTSLLKLFKNNLNCVSNAQDKIKCIPYNGVILDEEQRNTRRKEAWL